VAFIARCNLILSLKRVLKPGAGQSDGNRDGLHHKSGLKQPNEFGLFDIYGNVAEWVLDFYNPEGYSSNLAGVKQVKLYPRVVRGGSFKDSPEKLRSAARGFR